MNSVNQERDFFYEIIVYSLQLIDIKRIEEAIKELPVTIKNEVMSAYETLIQRGEYKTKIEVIINGHKVGVPINTLSLLTNLTESEVIDIIKKYQK